MQEHFYVVNEDNDEVYGYYDGLTEQEAEDLLESLYDQNPYASWDIDSSYF